MTDVVRVVDEAGLVDLHGVLVAACGHDYVGLPADPIEALRPGLTGMVGGEEVEYLAAYDAGVPVAAVCFRFPVHDNVELANFSLNVHPDHRRRGHGGRVVAAALDRARAHSRTRALVEVAAKTRHFDPAPGEAFARSLGAEPLHAETRRLIDLSLQSGADLDRWQAEAELGAAGYSTVAWRGRTPAAFVADMAALTALMSTDPPQGELALEPEIWDAERYLEHEAAVVARRSLHLTVAAREDSTGRLVGFTALDVPSAGASVGFQWETVVSGEHRGHRLGLLLKVANLRELRRAQPEVRYLNTWNADENIHMVAVNEKIGFRPMETWTEWGLGLAG